MLIINNQSSVIAGNTGTAPPNPPCTAGLFQSQVKKSKERAIAT
ncbi:hypothetical protein PL10110_960001 [Planktothrix agardhii]|nr:hypothetical protein PL10110_960001 [Planktothrix agardhii]